MQAGLSVILLPGTPRDGSVSTSLLGPGHVGSHQILSLGPPHRQLLLCPGLGWNQRRR